MVKFSGSRKTHGLRVGHTQHYWRLYKFNIDMVRYHGRWKSVDMVDLYDRCNAQKCECKYSEYNCYYEPRDLTKAALTNCSFGTGNPLIPVFRDNKIVTYKHRDKGGCSFDNKVVPEDDERHWILGDDVWKRVERDVSSDITKEDDLMMSTQQIMEKYGAGNALYKKNEPAIFSPNKKRRKIQGGEVDETDDDDDEIGAGEW